MPLLLLILSQNIMGILERVEKSLTLTFETESCL
jgi:hypothetical protein